jgi:hypothetical protein
MRVVQDSDDELDEDLEVDLQPPRTVNASVTPHERGKDASSTPGTGSTGALAVIQRVLSWNLQNN